LKLYLLIAILGLSGCSWFHRRQPPAPPPSELIVTGVPANSRVLIDGTQAGEPADVNNRTQVVKVSPGTHVVEIKTGDKTAYRESPYVAAGEKRVVVVLSGDNRS
jgi:hypothetical protein